MHCNDTNLPCKHTDSIHTVCTNTYLPYCSAVRDKIWFWKGSGGSYDRKYYDTWMYCQLCAWGLFAAGTLNVHVRLSLCAETNFAFWTTTTEQIDKSGDQIVIKLCHIRDQTPKARSIPQTMKWEHTKYWDKQIAEQATRYTEQARTAAAVESGWWWCCAAACRCCRRTNTC